MPKPPASPPSSDIDGVDEDQVRNIVAAEASGETTENLELARRQSKAKPVEAHESKHDSADDRSK